MGRGSVIELLQSRPELEVLVLRSSFEFQVTSNIESRAQSAPVVSLSDTPFPPNLRHLDAPHGCLEFLGSMHPPETQLPKLEGLDVCSFYPTSRSLSCDLLNRLPNLRKLRVIGLAFDVDRDLDSIFEMSPHLEWLEFSASFMILDRMPKWRNSTDQLASCFLIPVQRVYIQNYYLFKYQDLCISVLSKLPRLRIVYGETLVGWENSHWNEYLYRGVERDCPNLCRLGCFLTGVEKKSYAQRHLNSDGVCTWTTCHREDTEYIPCDD